MQRGRQGHEDGAVVVEFAVVFILFMTLVWGLISYGVIFAVQQSVSHAAAEATRAAVDVPGTAAARTRADAVLTDQLDWLDDAGLSSTIDADVPCDTAIYPADTTCLVVEVSYDWESHAIIPTMLDVATPSAIRSRAVIVRD